MEERSVRRIAPAKVNLYLHLTGKRADGYHLLESLVAFAGVGDVLEARSADELTLEVGGPFAQGLIGDGGNLVMRAARALAAAGGVAAGAAIRLEKRLPVSAGLGGGSADAAAALRALAELWRLSPSEDDLLGLGLDLGADVPACLAGKTVFVSGIGEVMTRAPALPPAHVVLANPGAPVETARVYAAFMGELSRPLGFDERPASVAELARVLAARGNDLQAPATMIVPEISEVIDVLERQPRCLLARMSGSGATCFGLFAEDSEARAAASAARAAQPAWWVVAAPLIDRVDSPRAS